MKRLLCLLSVFFLADPVSAQGNSQKNYWNAGLCLQFYRIPPVPLGYSPEYLDRDSVWGRTWNVKRNQAWFTFDEDDDCSEWAANKYADTDNNGFIDAIEYDLSTKLMPELAIK